MSKKISVIGVISSLSFLMMFLEFNIPIFPNFLKFDFSDLPVLFLSINMPLYGLFSIFIRNIIHVFFSSNFGVGEFLNFLISGFFITFSGYLFKKYKTNFIFIFSILLSSFFAIIINYYIMLPMYDLILNISKNDLLYYAKMFNPNIDNLFNYFLMFIFPFNLIKFTFVSLIFILSKNKLGRVVL
ncbi:ECF transporter S component [Oceanotoga teriensis]|uniref:Riboflavin transporter n=1 Tax=Oceanotoga teriensis TaxID=515440 RepID=A0AA45C7W7_9BACT|nr:ECF transporter S component [Oceanotoga teriensis]MDO7977100.1 ECF transporter S component [Oceanotoga teriensis]PWJ95598.1 riboflavin transporter FmnP [Oceanotoga teriensis]